MYDLHTHTLYSDGELIPAEAAIRAMHVGYKGIALTDHADSSNLTFILDKLLLFKENFNSFSNNFKVIIGVELTHILPMEIEKLKNMAIDKGADIVLVHGETIVEPVLKETNRAAIDAGIDILAHPGLITGSDAKLALKNNVYLEISSRKGHSYTNGHVFKIAKEYGCKLVVNNDAHAPGDYLPKKLLIKILQGAGCLEADIDSIFKNNTTLFSKKLGEDYS